MTRARENADLPVAMTESGGDIGVGTPAEPSRTLTLAGQSGQWDVNLRLKPTTHATSERCGIEIDDWLLATDLAGTDDGGFGVYKPGPAWVMQFDSSGRVTMPSQPSFCTRLLANTTTAGAKWTTNGTPQHNVGNHWSTSTHRFTCPVSGRYMLLCSGYTNYTTSYGYMALYINGTNQGAYSRHFNHNGNQVHTGMSMNVIFDLNANDYVEWGRPGAGGGTFDIVNVAAYLLS